MYVELTGGRQRGLELVASQIVVPSVAYAATHVREPRLIEVSAEALTAHAAFVARLKDPVWSADGEAQGLR